MASLLFAKLAEEIARGEPLVHLDTNVAAWFGGHRDAPATALFEAVTSLGGTQVLAGTCAAAALALLTRRRFAEGAALILVFAGSHALNALLKGIFERPRPSGGDAPIAHAAGFSFPSGHAMTSLVLYGAIMALVLSQISSPRARAAIFAAVMTLVAAIGLSRMYLGVHYMSDVLAGFAAGAAWLAVCGVAYRVARGRARSALRPASRSTRSARAAA